MKRYITGILFLAMLSLSACTTEEFPTPGTDAPDNEEQTQPVAGELMIKFAPYVSDILDRMAVATRSGERTTRSGILSVDEVLERIGGYEIERVFPLDRRTEERTRNAGLHLWYRVRFSAEHSVEEVAERLSQLGEIQSVNLNRTIKRAYNADKKAIPLTSDALRQMQQVTRAASTYPYNDVLLPKQWHLINRGDMFVQQTPKSIVGADVQCEEAWKLSTGDPSIIVAVLDEGVCVTHPDLMENMWINEGESYRSQEDNDGNGYKGDVYGYNFVADTGIISWDDVSDTGHASHVAGVIAAMNDNGEGIGSIAGGTPQHPGVKIMTCQIFSGDTQSNALASIKAIKYAADNGAVILQCSWGYVSGRANVYEWGAPGFESEEQWAKECQLEKEVLDYFVHNAGSPNGPIDGGIAIFAAGNENAPMAGFPGAAEDFVSVSATAADFTPSTYTNYGPGTTIAAPGGDQEYYYEYTDGSYRGETGCVLSTLPYNVSETGYGYMEGTSMACPHVSGVVALGLSYAAQLRRHFTADEFKQLLYETTTPIDGYLTGLKTFYSVLDIFMNQPKQLTLANYRTQMGVGQVNAVRLLNAIEGSGRPITFPNLYVKLDSEITVIPANYFVGGEQLTYTVTIGDTSVATATIDGRKLLVKGLKVGTTQASITADNGQTHPFVITVRKNASNNGWL